MLKIYSNNLQLIEINLLHYGRLQFEQGVISVIKQNGAAGVQGREGVRRSAAAAGTPGTTVRGVPSSLGWRRHWDTQTLPLWKNRGAGGHGIGIGDQQVAHVRGENQYRPANVLYCPGPSTGGLWGSAANTESR